MTPKLVTFIRLLRAEGLRLSVAESLDALRSIRHVGIDDREQLRLALRTTLVKSQRDFATFDALFERFFTVPRRRRRRRTKRRDTPGAAIGPRATANANGKPSRPPQQPQQPSSTEVPTAAQAQQNQMLQAHEEDHKADALAALEQAWQQQLQNRPQHRAAETPNRDEALAQTRLDRDFPPDCLADMYRDVERLVARLLTRRALRYRRAHHGRFDLRRTVLQSLRSGSEVPFTLAYRRRHIGKLRLVVLCDVSGSVWQVSTFFLKLVHTLQAEFTSVRSFLFVSSIVDVTPWFRHMCFPDDLDALRHYPNLNLFGYSDFGRAFYQFYRDILGELSRDTVLVILGDARNNAFDPQEWTLAEIRQRCKRLIWLNPEPRQRWNQDDSVIDVYAPLCDEVLEFRTMADLAHAADVLLQS